MQINVNTGERDVDVCLNARGDRVECGNPQHACDKRALIIGDSFAEALAIPFAYTVWGRMERLTGLCTDVSAVGGYDIGQYVQTARERVPAGDYDLVFVSFYAGNDFGADAERIPDARQVQRQPILLLPEGVRLDQLRKWFYPYNSWLESRSHAYVALRYTIRRFRDPGDVGIYGVSRSLRPSRLTDQYLDETARGIGIIARLAKDAGARVLVSVLPTRAQVLDPDGSRLLRGLPRLRGDIDMNLVSDKFVPRLRAVEEIDAVVDLLPLFRARADDSYWGKRDAHLSPAGHRLWLEGIRDPLLELLGNDLRTDRRAPAAQSRPGLSR